MEIISGFLNVTDISVSVLILLGMLGGARRGLSGELTRLICILVAFFAAWKTFPYGAEWLSNRSEMSTQDLNWISFVAITAITYFALSTVRHLLRLFLDFSFKGKLELLGGALIGFIRSIVFCVAALFAAALIPSEPVQQKLTDSYSGSAVINHLLPVYEKWVEENPEFQLPDIAPVGDVGIETLPWDEHLGPLIDEAADGENTE